MSFRGRQSNRRGRSTSRSRGNRRGRGVDINFNTPERMLEAESKQEQVKQVLADNKVRSEKAKPTQPSKIEETVDIGKEFISKFFKGFTEKERGNIKVTIDDELPERIGDVYKDKIYQMAYDKFKSPGEGSLDEMDEEEEIEEGEIPDQYQLLESHQRKNLKRFVGGISIAMAVKLQTSATQKEKDKNYNIPVLHRKKFFIPERTSVLLNQLGKTDLEGGNRIRIIGQDLAAKRMLVKGIYYILGHKEINKYVEDEGHANARLLRKIMNDAEMFGNMIDNSLGSLETLKQRARIKYEELSNENLNAIIKIGENEYDFNYRLPRLSKDEYAIGEIVAILKDPIFQSLEFKNEKDKDKWIQIMAVLSCFVCKKKWLTEGYKKMSQLNTEFTSTIIADISFNDVLLVMKTWMIGSFFSDSILSELGSLAAHRWESVMNEYSRDIKFKEINFSEYGGDAQMVEISDDKLKKITNHKNFFSRVINGRQIPETKLKISEHGAILGLASRLVRSVKFKTDFEINFSTTNHDILREFLKSDFK